MGQVNADVAVTDEFAVSSGVGPVDVSKKRAYGVSIIVDVKSVAAGTFTAAVTDICTKVAHGYKTGLKVQLTTTGTLPAGLALATDYFVIYLSADTFSLATSSSLAVAGTAIDITDTGTGTHTITPTAIAGASVKLQGSMDGVIWFSLPIKASGDVTKSSNITVDSGFFLCETDICVNYIRPYYTLTAGQISVSQVAKVNW